MSRQNDNDPAPLSDAYLRAHTVGELKPLAGRIHLVEYDPEWPRWFQEHAAKIREVLGPLVLAIEHVGSTAVPDLPAKPILDLVLTVENSADETAYVPPLEHAGYRLHLREAAWYEHRMFKGPGNSVNLHVFSRHCPEIERMLAFRDRLRNSGADRELYARTKRSLAERDWNYTQNYADAKTVVIREILARGADPAP